MKKDIAIFFFDRANKRNNQDLSCIGNSFTKVYCFLLNIHRFEMYTYIQADYLHVRPLKFTLGNLNFMAIWF